MSPLALAGLQLGLVVLVILIIPCAYRVWKGPSAAERLQAVDAITTLLMAIIIVLALLQGISMFIDVAIALAAFSFIGTLGMARYISEGKVF
jgi:multisubunit Na+/H+ antiporter MnhF subunit